MQHPNLEARTSRAPFSTGLLTAGLLTAGLLVLPSTVLAQGPDDGPRGHFRGNHWEHFSERFDTNDDGAVSREEFQREDDRFERMDRNDDGQLTAEDFEGLERRRARFRGHGPGFGAMLHGADADQNREVSAEEWQSFLVALDADGNGAIAAEEIQAHGEAQRELRGLPARPEPPAGAPDLLALAMERADKDGDGTLETSDLQTIFDDLDANDDGNLDADELPRFRHRGPRGAERGGRERFRHRGGVDSEDGGEG